MVDCLSRKTQSFNRYTGLIIFMSEITDLFKNNPNEKVQKASSKSVLDCQCIICFFNAPLECFNHDESPKSEYL